MGPCRYCRTEAVDPVKPWGATGGEACRACFASADALAESRESFGLPLEPIIYIDPERPETVSKRLWRERRRVPVASTRPTRKEQQIATARKKLIARGYLVEAA